MRPGRAAVHTALPFVALAALAVLGAVQPVAAATGPSVQPAVVAGRIITDGHPVPLRAARVRPAPAVRVSAPRPVLRPARPVALPAPSQRPAPPAARPTATAAPRRVVTDDYPYASDGGNGTDPWGFTKRQCVSYVAWRLAQAGRPLDNGRDGWGSALYWDDVAQRLGRPVTTRAAVGAVAHWNAGERSAYWGPGAATSNGTFAAGDLGHVAWIVSVYSDGSVLVAQYNGTGDRSYSTMRVRAPRYLRL